MKKILSVMLAVLMIAGCMAISFSASARETEIRITVTAPVAGEMPNTTIKTEPTILANYLREVTFYTGEPRTSTATETTAPFVAGESYFVTIYFDSYNELTNEHDFGFNNTVFYVNGTKLTGNQVDIVDTNAAHLTYSFGVCEAAQSADPEPTAPVCAWCGKDHSNGFFQMIIGWFHGILANLFGAKY
ncbi:MAG: hypothetical protein IKN72_08785 [Clostridia bacterium]|nr:hypothetical protein [Clostridia bacterium]